MEISKMKSNYGMGPRTGNSNPGEKRAAFKEGKTERSALADQVKAAYANHSWEKKNTKHDPMVEPINEEIKVPKKFKR